MNKTDLDALLKYGYTLEELLGFNIDKSKKTYDFCRDINLNNISPMEINTTCYYETDKDRIERCKNCKYAIILPLIEANEPPDTLFCKLIGYPCDMIIQCEKGDTNNE